MSDGSNVPQAAANGAKVQHVITTADLTVVSGLALCILVGGLAVLWMILQTDRDQPSNLWGERLGQYTLQILGLTFVLPTILIIAVATGLEAEAVTALLGSIIGYIFGSSRAAETSTQTAPAPKAQLASQTSPEPKDSPVPPPSHTPPEPKDSPAPEATAAPPNTPPAGAAPSSS